MANSWIMNLRRLKFQPLTIEGKKNMAKAKDASGNHAINSNSKKSAVEIVFLPIDSLRLHEKGLREYFEAIRREILTDGCLKYPVIADRNSHVILDGAHRWLTLKSLGCQQIPTLLVDVNQKPGVRVGTRRIHRYNGNSKIPVQDVISAGLKGQLMEPRSTRHFFPFSKFQLINCPLSELGQDSPQDVSQFLEDAPTERSEAIMQDWLNEIYEEIIFLVQRKEEVEKEHAELKRRLESLKP